MDKDKTNDPLSNENIKAINEIIHSAFLNQGTMIACGLNFPGVTELIAPDESHVTALDVTDEGIVYGGTSGTTAHLFVGMFNRATGAVFDMGKVEGSQNCVAVCCGKQKIVGCFNDSDTGRIIICDHQIFAGDFMQEAIFYKPVFKDLGQVVKGEKIIHAIHDDSGKFVIGLTQNHLFTFDIEQQKIEIAGQLTSKGKLSISSEGNIYGLDEDNTLFKYNLGKRELTRKAIKLPKGNWQKHPLTWANDKINNKLYTTDSDGRIFSFTEETGFSDPLAKTPVEMVTTMAATNDGRLFGSCGEGIAKMFCYNPDSGEMTNLGVAVSVLQRRRYGYVFADAVTAPDGQIFFTENDTLGHLWIYFPAIQKV